MLSREHDGPADGEAVGAAAGARRQRAAHPGLGRVTCAWDAGVPTLRGPVRTDSLKQLARAGVQGLAGVTATDNRLDVVPAQALPPVAAGEAGGRRGRRPLVEGSDHAR